MLESTIHHLEVTLSIAAASAPVFVTGQTRYLARLLQLELLDVFKHLFLAPQLIQPVSFASFLELLFFLELLLGLVENPLTQKVPVAELIAHAVLEVPQPLPEIDELRHL